MYHKWHSYDIWFPRYWAWQTEFFVILDHFLPFQPPNNPKNQNFSKTETMSRDIIILHKCTKNDDHMLYCSWDMAHNGCNCHFSFWDTFCTFTSLTAQKSKLKKRWKKRMEISSFYNSVPKIIVIYYTVPEIWHIMDVNIFHFGPFFVL